MRKAVVCLGMLAVACFMIGCEEFYDDSSEFPSGARWIWGRDISDWPATINLKSASVRKVRSNYYQVIVDYDRLQDIPKWYVPGDANNRHHVNGSIWLIRQYEGQWYIGTIDYLRVNQKWKNFGASRAYRFVPTPGDKIGFMVSTCARFENGTVSHGDPGSPYRERSNIVWITWPEL